jgi:hypothetical protein
MNVPTCGQVGLGSGLVKPDFLSIIFGSGWVRLFRVLC